MDALRRSVQEEKGKPEKEPARKATKGRKRAEGQREMLLPISGKKKDAKEAAKPAARRKAG
jgi:DNA end-binding protein Ku